VTGVLTVTEVAVALRVHPETVRRLLRDGALAGEKVGSVWRVHADALSRHDPPVATAPRPRPVTGEKRRLVRKILAERHGGN
jgi:excisionase family DNA binding protein